MTPGDIDAFLATPQELAGRDYDEMLSSQESAMGLLSAHDYKTSLAAAMICEQNWNAGSDPRVVQACRRIAKSNAEDSFRIVAIDILSRAFSSTKHPGTSGFVAELVLDPQNSIELRTDAYWALREIQYGVDDVDFMLGTIHVVKRCLRRYPDRFSEESVKSALLGNESFPDDFWDSADQIDWKFVHQFDPRRNMLRRFLKRLALVILSLVVVMISWEAIYEHNAARELDAYHSLFKDHALVALRNLTGSVRKVVCHGWQTENGPESEKSLDQLCSILQQFHSLNCLMLDDHPQLNNNIVRRIADLESVEELYLMENPQITDPALQYLARMPNLHYVDLSGTGVTEKGLEWFRSQRPDVHLKWDHGIRTASQFGVKEPR